MAKSEIRNPKSEICLTIAGVDPSGGAGIYADLKTFSAFGCYGAAAIASITFQNTTGVFGAANQSAETVRRQVEPILADFEISAIKTGMLPTREIIEEVARLVREYDLKNFVVDPVVRSTSGFDLIDDAALRSLTEKLFPLSDIITPNLPEAERISRMKIETEADIRKAASIMRQFGAENVLIKGGHSVKTKGKKRKAKDFLFVGDEMRVFEADFIETKATHGTGCTLASAIAANLALGENLTEAVRIAKNYVTEAIKHAPGIGHGMSPVNHFVRVKTKKDFNVFQGLDNKK